VPTVLCMHFIGVSGLQVLPLSIKDDDDVITSVISIMIFQLQFQLLISVIDFFIFQLS